MLSYVMSGRSDSNDSCCYSNDRFIFPEYYCSYPVYKTEYVKYCDPSELFQGVNYIREEDLRELIREIREIINLKRNDIEHQHQKYFTSMVEEMNEMITREMAMLNEELREEDDQLGIEISRNTCNFRTRLENLHKNEFFKTKAKIFNSFKNFNSQEMIEKIKENEAAEKEPLTSLQLLGPLANQVNQIYEETENAEQSAIKSIFKQLVDIIRPLVEEYQEDKHHIILKTLARLISGIRHITDCYKRKLLKNQIDDDSDCNDKIHSVLEKYNRELERKLYEYFIYYCKMDCSN